MNRLESMAGLLVVDLGSGMAAALVAKMLAEAGAQVVRFEPSAGDPFYTVYPAYASWHAGSSRPPAAEREDWLARADVCLVGGEDFPDLDWSFDPESIVAANGRAVVLDLTGYPGGHSAQGRPAVDLLVQARTGLSYEVSDERPMHLTFPAPTYGAALHGLVGILAALIERGRSGKGQVVTTSLQQGGLPFVPFWMDAERADRTFNRNIPKDAAPLLFRCADGRYIHFSTGGSPDKAYDLLGIPRPETPHPNWFGDTERIGQAVASYHSGELLKRMSEAGLAAEVVLAPGQCWDEPQVLANQIIRPLPDGSRGVGLPLKFRTPGDTGGQAAAEAPPSSATRQEAQPPLQGVRVVDFGHFVAGPYASRVLADLGADVVKVESLGGDLMRKASFQAVYSSNRGKRSLAVDAKNPRGAEIVRLLCATANVAHHNFRPGVAERLALDPASLREVRPDLVTMHASAYGTSGPRMYDSGFDPIIQAYCGHEVRAGGAGNDPLWYRLLIVDYSAGLLGAIGLLLGVYEQQQAGRAVEIECSLLDTGVFLLSELIQTAEGGFEGAPSTNRNRTGYHPAEALYQTRDGWIAVAARSEAMAARLVQWAGLDLGPRASWHQPEEDLLQEYFGRMGTDEALAGLAAEDIWAEECVRDGWRELNSAGVNASLLQNVQDPQYGMIRSVDNLIGFSRSAAAARQASAPRLGEDTAGLLTELGYSPSDIEDLLEGGAVAVVRDPKTHQEANQEKAKL
ncbi:CoA transferase [Arthrobacter sp. I2-34]|uniref:CoA transferase n=1 Tax=Arthrobacter hankyongi TaxID=2904801 RepID=A0ABS9L3T8_9MICC|nr:CoA transferase [Arthrobacter hankyongi]MCG2621309.1 CoA transferase [Arthrobacter hankyongi]